MVATPIRLEQIEAACRLHSRLEHWKATDRALEALATRFPAFDLDSSLLKATAVNGLYGTNVFAIVRMAQHISRVFSAPLPENPEDLVREIACLPSSQAKHWSFASKFCHFFVDNERFPIYDSYAAKMVKHHLGKFWTAQADNEYAGFTRNLIGLLVGSDIRVSVRQLDRYLWLAGLHQAWSNSSEAAINTEVKRLFQNPSQEDAKDISLLTTQGSYRSEDNQLSPSHQGSL